MRVNCCQHHTTGDSLMLLWSWVTWAVRPCCLSFKCSHPDSSFPYCVMVVKVFKGQSLLSTPSKGVTNQNICSLLKSLQEKRYVPSNSSSLPLTLIHICLAPLCLAAAATALSRGPAGRYSCSQHLLLRP